MSLPGQYIHDLIMPSTPYKRFYYTRSTNNISTETWIQEFQPLFMSEQVPFAVQRLTSYLWFNKKKRVLEIRFLRTLTLLHGLYVQPGLISFSILIRAALTFI